MYPDSGSFNWSGVLAGVGAAVGSAFSQPADYNTPSSYGFAPYNYGAFGQTYATPTGVTIGASPTGGFSVIPAFADTYNNNSGFLSGSTGTLVLIVAIIIGVALIVK